MATNLRERTRPVDGRGHSSAASVTALQRQAYVLISGWLDGPATTRDGQTFATVLRAYPDVARAVLDLGQVREGVLGVRPDLQAIVQDPRYGLRVRERAEKDLRDIQRSLATAATEWLADGLNRRVGYTPLRLPLLTRTVNILLALGGQWPSVPSVCETCGIVFEHPYAARRARCDECHASPHRSPAALRATDDDGNASWLRGVDDLFRDCVNCGAVFTGRGGAQTCSARCRQALRRSAQRAR